MVTTTAFNANSISGNTMIPVAVNLSKVAVNLSRPDFDSPAQGKIGSRAMVKLSVKLPEDDTALTVPA